MIDLGFVGLQLSRRESSAPGRYKYFLGAHVDDGTIYGMKESVNTFPSRCPFLRSSRYIIDIVSDKASIADELTEKLSRFALQCLNNSSIVVNDAQYGNRLNAAD